MCGHVQDCFVSSNPNEPSYFNAWNAPVTAAPTPPPTAAGTCCPADFLTDEINEMAAFYFTSVVDANSDGQVDTSEVCKGQH